MVAFGPPPIRGLSSTGGVQLQVQDLGGEDLQTLSRLTQDIIKRGNARPDLVGLYTTFRATTPQLYVDIDRTKAKSLGVAISDIASTLQIYLGSLYVNDFNKYGRVYRVFMQADERARGKAEDIGRLYVRNAQGQMIPLSTLATVSPKVGPQTVEHFNLFRTAQITASPAPGKSSGQAIEAMEELAREILPAEMGFEWTGIAFQELQAGNVAPIIFSLALAFVFLFLAAQYESWVMPFMVMLSVPLALLGALFAQHVRGLANDIYCQIGLVMLIGLASKNAILIVEFARRRREEGLTIEQSAMEAARVRLRPILMTSFAFILGVLPLTIATGAGAAGRHSLGTAVFGGMVVSTFLNLVVVPVFYVVIERLRERFGAEAVAAPAATGPPRPARGEMATDTARSAQPLDHSQRRLTLVAMCIGQGMILLDNTIVNVALPAIQHGLGVTPGNLEWTVNAYVLALASLIILGGTLGDRYGRKRLYLIGLVVFTIFSAACGLASRDAGADRLPRTPGRRRGADGAPHALHPGRRLSPRGAHHRHRDLGERGRARLRGRTHRGRPAHRAIRLACRLLGQRAHRHRRLRARAGGRAGIAGSGGARARPRRQRARLRRPLPLDVRLDRDQRASLALSLYALAGRVRRRAPRRLPRPRGAHRASDGAARPVRGPGLQLRQRALHARLRLARRDVLLRHALLSEREGLVGGQDRHVVDPSQRALPGNRAIRGAHHEALRPGADASVPASSSPASECSGSGGSTWSRRTRPRGRGIC